jgi:hypothetical protein
MEDFTFGMLSLDFLGLKMTSTSLIVFRWCTICSQMRPVTCTMWSMVVSMTGATSSLAVST